MIPDYSEFAKEWEAAWNSHDLDRIMEHYAQDIVFRSRKAFAHMGIGELHGKMQLRAYWQAALDRQPDLRFRVEQVLGGHMMAVIVYRNHRDVCAAETLFFDAEGRVVRASACHDSWDMPNPYRIQVDLWVLPGKHAEFAVFEKTAFAAMARYGAHVLAVEKPQTGPDERHILEFPNELAFDAYRAGPEVAAASRARSECVARTEISKL